MPTNPLATFRAMVLEASRPMPTEEPLLQAVIAGDAPDNMPEPWAQIRGAGGPQGDKQCLEDYQRFDVNVYDQNQLRGDQISRQIFRAMRDIPALLADPTVKARLLNAQGLFEQDFDGMIYQTCVISVDAEGGPFQLVDTDRRTPFTFRSYVMFYGEDF